MIMRKKISKNTAQKKLLKKITEVVEKRIRPYMRMDGGDIEIVGLTPKKILKVRLRGMCVGCPAAPITLEMGVQNLILEEFPGKDIKVVLV